jgi:hypothetical protein
MKKKLRITKDGNYTTYHNVAVVQGGLPEYGTDWWSEKQWKEHEESEKRLKASGEWGKTAYFDISVVDNPMYDDVSLLSQSTLGSAHFEIFDFSK